MECFPDSLSFSDNRKEKQIQIAEQRQRPLKPGGTVRIIVRNMANLLIHVHKMTQRLDIFTMQTFKEIISGKLNSAFDLRTVEYC